MSENQGRLTPRKKMILKLACGLLVVLIVCTIVSRSVYNMLLPTVEVVEAAGGTIDTWADAQAEFDYTNKVAVRAGSTWKINRINVIEGKRVFEGDTMFEIDMDQQKISTERMELSLMQLKNSLKPSQMTEVDKKLAEIEIKIAEGQLEAYEYGLPLSSEIQELTYELAVIRAENGLMENELAAQYASDMLFRYRSNGVMFDRTEEKKLRSKLISLGSQLRKTGLSDEKREELQNEFDRIQQELTDLMEQYVTEDYDPIQEEQLRLAAMQANNQIYYDGDEDRSISALNLEIAKLQLEQFYQQNAYSREKLELNIEKMKNELSNAGLTPEKQAEINLQIKIAQEELALQKSKFPEGGLVKAPHDCVFVDLYVSEGEIVQEGQLLGYITNDNSSRCVTWQMSYEAGRNYPEASDVTVTVSNPSAGNDTLEAKVSNKRQNKETGDFTFIAPIDYQKIVTNETSATIRLQTTSPTYEVVVPLSCIRTNEAGDQTVWLVQTRDGLFSQENYLVEATISITKANSLYAAISGRDISRGVKIMRYSSKSVSPGSVVSIAE